MAVSADQRFVYAATHTSGSPGSDSDDGGSGGVTAVKITWAPLPMGPSFQVISVVACDEPTHVALHPSGRWLFSASYGQGTLSVMPVGADGTISPPTSVLAVGIKAHEVVFAGAMGQFVFVPCLGNDFVAQLSFDPIRGTLAPNELQPAAYTPPSSGPRHMVFHPTLPVAYVLCELASLLVAFPFNASTGVLGVPLFPPLSTIRANYPNGEPQVQAAAAVVISNDGRFLYATNRASPAGTGDNNVAVVALAPGSGNATVVAWADGGGGSAPAPGSAAVNYPRDACLSPDAGGSLLMVTNQNGASFTIFVREPQSGGLAVAGFAPAGSVVGPSYCNMLPQL